MAGLRVEIRGIDNLRDRLNNLRPRVRRATEQAVQESGRAMERGMKSLAPVDTGALRDSIRHTVEGTTASAGPGREVDYAAFVEFGTSRMAAQPYVRPIAEAERHLFPERVRLAVRASLRSRGRGRGRR